MKLTLQVVKGTQILPYISDLAKLRINIFKDYPYLYVGNDEYEANYLKTYIQCPECVMVLAFDEKKVIGASTAIPLEFESHEFQQPFLEHGKDIKDIFYLGESLLLPDYRGKGIYSRFFELREKAAREYGCHITVFASVQRAPDDPRRPSDYQPLDPIWNHFGYEKHPELIAFYPWQEMGENTSSPKQLVFWLKKL